MQKVVFSVSKAGRSQSKVSGVGYIDDKNLYIPSISSKGNAYIRVFEDCIKRPITEGEYSTTHYEFHTVEFEVMNASKTDKVGIETREICVTYFIWFKII